ncbi:HAMP domain protein, partial [Vibrio parahaemolyticus V-223/04]
VMMNVMQNL